VNQEQNQALWFSRSAFEFGIVPKAGSAQESAENAYKSDSSFTVTGLTATQTGYYENSNTGFKAQVNIPKDPNSTGPIYLGLTGTDGTPTTAGVDLANGAMIGWPPTVTTQSGSSEVSIKAPQLIDAENIYEALRAQYPGREIIVTGQSLGGGLAQYLTGKYGVESYAFNSVGASNSLLLFSGVDQSTLNTRAQSAHVYNMGNDPVSLVGVQYGDVKTMPGVDGWFDGGNRYPGLPIGRAPGMSNHVYPLYSGDDLNLDNFQSSSPSNSPPETNKEDTLLASMVVGQYLVQNNLTLQQFSAANPQLEQQYRSWEAHGQFPDFTDLNVPNANGALIGKVTFTSPSSNDLDGTIIEKDLNGKFQDLTNLNFNPNGTVTGAASSLDNGGTLESIRTFSNSAVGTPFNFQSTSIIGNNADSAPSGTTVGPNQFYVDSTKYNLITWADVANALGVSEAALRAANPGSQNVPSPANTVINLTTIDNSNAPTVTITSNPQAQTGVADETDLASSVSSGFTEESATESIEFNHGELNATDLVSATEASLVSGGVRPGEVQLDPNNYVNAVLEDGELDPSAANAGMVNAATFGNLEANSFAEVYVDPILLDLTGAGIGTTSVDNSPILFDMDHSGTQQRTGWADTQTGMLVVPDANGKVTNVSQMFSQYFGGAQGTNGAAGTLGSANGQSFVNGFDALGAQDSNQNGVIDSGDTIWNQLRVWVDANHNGQVDTGELTTLAQRGITSFNLGNALDGSINNGNPVTATSSFVINGQTRTMSDVNLISDSAHNVFTTQGTGTIDTTTAKNNGTQTVVKTYTEGSSTGLTLNAATLNVDHLVGGAGNDTLIAKSTGSWLVGGAGSNTYQGGAGNDTFVVSASDDPANVHSGGGEDTVVVTGTTGMTINMAQMGVTIAEGGQGDDVIMSGGRTGVYIKGGSGTDLLIGGAGTDVIVGGSGHNTIIGGTGQAVIYAGPNGDLTRIIHTTRIECV